MKSCSKCHETKPPDCFSKDKSKRDGLCTVCKECRKDYLRAYYSDPVNAEKRKEKANRYYRENREEVAKRAKISRRKNSEHIRAKRKAQYWKDPEAAKEAARVYSLRRRWEDPVYRMAIRCRKRCWEAFSRSGYTKRSRTFDLIGCSQDELAENLESQFTDGMSWENYGEWHVDHIVPLASAKTEAEVEALCHYTNLQPLWAKDNIRKSNRLDNR